MEIKEDPRYCPVMDMICPQGVKKALECRTRFEAGFDPIRNLRDFEILCCSYRRTDEIQEDPALV